MRENVVHITALTPLPEDVDTVSFNGREFKAKREPKPSAPPIVTPDVVIATMRAALKSLLSEIPKQDTPHWTRIAAEHALELSEGVCQK